MADLNLLDADEVAKSLGIGTSTLSRLVKAGRFPPPIEVATRRCWPRQDIDDYLHQLCYARDWVHPNGKIEEKRTVPYDGEPIDLLAAVRSDLLKECTIPAVYFLLKKKAIIYVGISIHPMRRVREHRDGSLKTPAKDFDLALFFAVPLQELIEKERYFVSLLNPPLNSNLRTE